MLEFGRGTSPGTLLEAGAFPAIALAVITTTEAWAVLCPLLLMIFGHTEHVELALFLLAFPVGVPLAVIAGRELLRSPRTYSADFAAVGRSGTRTRNSACFARPSSSPNVRAAGRIRSCASDPRSSNSRPGRQPRGARPRCRAVGAHRVEGAQAPRAARNYRLLVAVETEPLALAMKTLIGTPLAAEVSSEALRHLDELFATPDSVGSELASRAEAEIGQPETVAVASSALANELLPAGGWQAAAHDPRDVDQSESLVRTSLCTSN
jgi:hypothetical protein